MSETARNSTRTLRFRFTDTIAPARKFHDFTEDLKKIDIPVLVLHGDDDQIVPIVAAGLLSAKILKNATLRPSSSRSAGILTTA
jgi:pimeloyl-ACP methyl ester carboxylesterase